MSTTTLNLSKDQKVDLTKTNPGLAMVAAAMGWDVNAGNSGNFDLDASVLALDANGKLFQENPRSVLYFGSEKDGAGKPSIMNGSLVHSGDNLTGAGDGDDETIIVDLSKVPAGVEALLFIVNIYDAESRRQNFGMVKNAYIRLYDATTNQELKTPDGGLIKFDLSEDYSSFNSMKFAKLYRHNGEWKFQTIGEGFNGNLNTAIANL